MKKVKLKLYEKDINCYEVITNFGDVERLELIVDEKVEANELLTLFSNENNTEVITVYNESGIETIYLDFIKLNKIVCEKVIIDNSLKEEFENKDNIIITRVVLEKCNSIEKKLLSQKKDIEDLNVVIADLLGGALYE